MKMKGTDFLGMMKLGVILAAFAAAACIMLAFVYSGTRPIIDGNDERTRNAAIMELFPEADNFKEIKDITSPDERVAVENAYAALKNGQAIGAVVSLSRAGYSGQIKTMVGVSAQGIITGVKILEHSDTPGLGANAASPSYFVDRERELTFYGQFAGKHVSHPFRVKDDVVAITASTVTSNAVSASVKAAGIAVGAWLKGEKVDAVSAATD